jgi:hypothetical protein
MFGWITTQAGTFGWGLHNPTHLDHITAVLVTKQSPVVLGFEWRLNPRPLIYHQKHLLLVQLRYQLSSFHATVASAWEATRRRRLMGYSLRWLHQAWPWTQHSPSLQPQRWLGRYLCPGRSARPNSLAHCLRLDDCSNNAHDILLGEHNQTTRINRLNRDTTQQIDTNSHNAHPLLLAIVMHASLERFHALPLPALWTTTRPAKQTKAWIASGLLAFSTRIRRTVTWSAPTASGSSDPPCWMPD